MAQIDIPLQDLKAEFAPIKTKVMSAIERVLDGMQLYLGPNVAALEAEFQQRFSSRYAVGVSSGTDALHLAYMALGVKSGDEVIVPSHTFIATVAPLGFLGARPVFCDIDPKTYNLDPALLESLITPRTVGITVVHIYGQTADMDPLMAVARRHGLWVVEDVAQAIGADYKGRPLGSIGDAGCFSFVYTKNIKAYGDAGMVTTNDPQVADRVRKLRDHGRTGKYEHPEFGFNSRLGEIEAAIVRIQMETMDARSEQRRANAGKLTARLGETGVVTPYESGQGGHVYHLYVIRTRRRDDLAAHLANCGIGSGVHYPIPCHMQGACSPYRDGQAPLPHTEKTAKEILSLPVYPEMTDSQLDRVASAVEEFSALSRKTG